MEFYVSGTKEKGFPKGKWLSDKDLHFLTIQAFLMLKTLWEKVDQGLFHSTKNTLNNKITKTF